MNLIEKVHREICRWLGHVPVPGVMTFDQDEPYWVCQRCDRKLYV